MSNGDEPRPNDLIRVSYEGRYGVLPSGQEYLSNPGVPNQLFYDGAAVEVLERADDPSKDPIGTLRREDVIGEGHHNLWQRMANPLRWMCTHSTATSMVGEVLRSDGVIGWPIVGSVPGTPAAAAEAESEYPPADRSGACRLGRSNPQIVYWVDHSSSSYKDDKIALVVFDPGGGPRVVEALNAATPHPSQVPGPRCNATEGATGIGCGLPRFHGAEVDHEGTHDPTTAGHDGIGYRLTVRWPWNEWDRDAAAVGFEVPLPDWEREILEQEAARNREPRVFSSDGPEPPEDVKILEWLDYDPDVYTHRFLRREGFGWAWVSTPDSATHTTITFWSPIAAKTSFREVLS